MSNLQRGALPPDISGRLHEAAQGADAALSRRAQIILSYHEGRSLTEIAREFGLTVSGAKYWIKQFEERGLRIFGEVEQANVTVEPEPEVALPMPEPEPQSEPIAETPKARRGRPPKAARPAEPEPEVAPPIPEPEPQPEPVPEPIAEPPKARRGRPPKVARPAEPEPEIVPPTPEPEPEPVAEPPKSRRGRKPNAAATPVVEPTMIVAEPEVAEPEPELPPREPITSVTGLVNHYHVDLKHARYVTEQAFILFDATAEVHRLPDKSRALLEAGALLHNVAYDVDPDEHHLRGRDIILETPLKGFTDDERRMIALLAAFHRKKVHPEREAAFIALPTELRRDVLSLAAILRLADGCDNSLTQTTTVSEVQIAPGELVIWLDGENAEVNAERIRKKSDLWEKQFDQRVLVEIVDNSEPVRPPASHVMTAPPIMRDHMPDLVMTLDPAMSGLRALRKLAMHYTDRLDRLAVQVRGGDDHRLPALEREIERLAGLLSLSQTERFADDLRWLAERTQAALVAFTLHDRAVSLADDADDPNAPIIAGQLGRWYHQAQTALKRLDFERYDTLIDALRRELVSEPNDDGTLNSALINTLVGPTVWRQLTELRDVMERGESVTDALQAVRRLQDYLLYFRSLLGPEAIQALDMLTPFESYLAAIHMVQSILALVEPLEQPNRHQASASEAEEIIRNLQMEMLNTLADGLPGAWASVNSQVFRRALALALATP